MKQLDYLTLAQELIRIESVSGSPQKLTDALNLCKKQLPGFSIEEFNSNGIPSLLVYPQKKRPKKFRLLLGGHVDVVPADKIAFSPRIKDGKLYGRGSVDMKAALAVLIDVFRLQSTKVDYPVGLQIVTDEEVGGHNGTGHQLLKDVRSEFTILGEYSDLKVNNASKGLCWVRVAVDGKSAHGAYPWRGVNATEELVTAISDIKQKHPTPFSETNDTTWNISWLTSASQVTNKSARRAEAHIDIRFNAQDPLFVDFNKKKIEQYIKSLTKVKLEVDIKTIEPACFTPPSHPDIELLRQHGAKGLLNTHGSSDLRFFETRGMNGVCFGPGGANPHAASEHVNINDLKQYHEILTAFIHSLNG